MIDTFRLFEPIGPLSYLIMTEEGKRKLGIYRRAAGGSLVLVLQFEERNYVIQPSFKKLDQWMRDEESLPDLLFTDGKLNLADIDGNKTSIFSALSVRAALEKEMAGKLSQIKSHVLYPNYYYLFREYTFESAM